MESYCQKLSNINIEKIIKDSGFNICHKKVEEKRDAVFVHKNDIGLSKRSLQFLNERRIESLWRHQAEAIKESIIGNNICVTTSTSSGKTEIFQLSAIEVLEKNKNSKILAIYPMKALNRQQVERWTKTGYSVGKIDGDVSDWEERQQALSNNRIIVMTPDVMHTFLLGKINDARLGESIKNFIKDVSLVIIDELHLYKGIFGTNSAYLFRRFNNLHRLLCKKDIFVQYITASATLPNATEHSYNITGVPNFVEIGAEQDGSPISQKTFYFIERNPDAKKEGKGLVTDLVYSLSQIDDAKSITFVEGRQKTGDVVNDSLRKKNRKEEEDCEDYDNVVELEKKVSANVEETGIYPYRAGYEKETIDNITRNLHDGNFKGVISTSALEIGIDIEGLNIAIIADMPHDKNSYQQRIGRVGRFGCDNSYVIVIRGNSFSSQLLFEEYDYDIDKVLPNYEPALYLEDVNVQNMHALCHVGDTESCEYLQWKGRINKERKFDGKGYFPESFVNLCQDVLSGQTTKMYEELASKVGNPHTGLSIRFFGKQFEILPSYDEKKYYIPKETINREQICTEGYVGAIRNTMCKNTNIKEEITGLIFEKNEIYARIYNGAKKTKSNHRKYLIPNFREEHRNETLYYGDTKIFNLKVTEHRTIYGYYESYYNNPPKYKEYGEKLNLPPLLTTGTIIFHPSLNSKDVNISQVANIIFELFLRRNAFDRNDISFLGGRLYNKYENIEIDSRFIAIYDASSLNISRRIVNIDLMSDLFSFLYKHIGVIGKSLFPNINEATINAVKDLCISILENKPNISYENLGNEYVYSFMTKIKYLKEDMETREIIEYDAKYLGGGSIEGTINIMYFDNGEQYPLSNVAPEYIMATSETKFETK